MTHPRIILAPPGSGKTTFMSRHPGRFIDPEVSIDWKTIAAKHTLYKPHARRKHPDARFEHELDWPSVWIHEVLPRLQAARLLGKDAVLGMTTPANAELVSRYMASRRADAAVVLPDLAAHYARVWHDEIKRPRSWGSEIRGWQNTYWVRLLLSGLAGELGIRTLEAFPEPALRRRGTRTRQARRVPAAAAREARIGRRHFLEAFPGRWVELDARQDILATLTLSVSVDGRLELTCDGTGKVCGRGDHACKKAVVIRKDAAGHAIGDWIPRDKIRAPQRGDKNAVLYFTGSFAPFHKGHLQAMEAAKKALEARGWRVVAGYAVSHQELYDRRGGALHDLLGPNAVRGAMTQLGLENSDWIMADVPSRKLRSAERLDAGTHAVQRVAARMRLCGGITPRQKVTTFWVNGKDIVMPRDFSDAFGRLADRNPLNPLRLLIVDNRGGDNKWTREALAEEAPGFAGVTEHVRVAKNPADTSATRIRAALETGNRAELRAQVGLPAVEAYLLGLMHGWH